MGPGEVVIAQADFVQAVRVSLNSISQRNATALFGAGKIDSIPVRVLEAAAKKYAEFPKVSGRVARDDKGRVGRFGWKAQKASLDDFVLTACAVELGLHVPDHDQPPLPHKPDYKAPGLDLNKAECDALIKYVGELPPPVELKAEHPKHADFIASGKSLFAAVGCATCHTPKLGDVEGIYSDLLLHDMGPALPDAGSSYGIFQPNPPPSAPQEVAKSPGNKCPPSLPQRKNGARRRCGECATQVPLCTMAGPRRLSKQSPSTRPSRGLYQEVQCPIVTGEAETAGVP